MTTREELEVMVEKVEAERTDSITMDKKVEDLLVAFKRYLDKEARFNFITNMGQWAVLILMAFILDNIDLINLIK